MIVDTTRKMYFCKARWATLLKYILLFLLYLLFLLLNDGFLSKLVQDDQLKWKIRPTLNKCFWGQLPSLEYIHVIFLYQPWAPLKKISKSDLALLLYKYHGKVHSLFQHSTVTWTTLTVEMERKMRTQTLTAMTVETKTRFASSSVIVEMGTL